MVLQPIYDCCGISKGTILDVSNAGLHLIDAESWNGVHHIDTGAHRGISMFQMESGVMIKERLGCWLECCCSDMCSERELDSGACEAFTCT